ncbi:MAG: hypothetical protein MW690_000511 [Methanophagales archaeon]|nr:hypothetical protein [Methanophagales archaeon]MCU4140710.1 hypothetical protein [Methanophagales archaeon]
MRSRTELKVWLRKERRRREKGGVKRGKEVGEREIVALSIVKHFPVLLQFPYFRNLYLTASLLCIQPPLQMSDEEVGNLPLMRKL